VPQKYSKAALLLHITKRIQLSIKNSTKVSGVESFHPPETWLLCDLDAWNGLEALSLIMSIASTYLLELARTALFSMSASRRDP